MTSKHANWAALVAFMVGQVWMLVVGWLPFGSWVLIFGLGDLLMWRAYRKGAFA